MKDPKTLLFDIEAGGLRGNTSSILSIAHATLGSDVPKELYALPAEGTELSYWAKTKVFEKIQDRVQEVKLKKQLTLQNEKAILSQFLNVLEKHVEQPGAVIAGWNIGYVPVPQRRGEVLPGFDIPMLVTRAEKYGLGARYQSAFRKATIRDIGQEFAVKVAREVTKRSSTGEFLYKNIVDEDLFRQAEGFTKFIDIGGLRGASIEQQARHVGSWGVKLSGWKQELLGEVLGVDVSGAHMAHEDIRAMEEIMQKKVQGESFVRKWNQAALQNKLVSQAKAGTINLEEYLARKGDLGRLETIVREAGGKLEDIRAGKGLTEPLFKVVGGRVSERPAASLGGRFSRVTQHALRFAGNHKIAVAMGVGAAALLAINPLSWFSGSDDEYNTIEGLPHGGEAGRLRRATTAFGSGFQGSEKEAQITKEIWGNLTQSLEKYGHKVGTGHKRLVFPQELITRKQLEKQLGFQPVKIAIPEAGQTTTTSWRHTENLYHIHQHGKNWVMHQDRHIASTMAAEKARKRGVLTFQKQLKYLAKGLPHVVTEGLPGAYFYAKGQLYDTPGMSYRVAKEMPAEYIEQLKELRAKRFPSETIGKEPGFWRKFLGLGQKKGIVAPEWLGKEGYRVPEGMKGGWTWKAKGLAIGAGIAAAAGAYAYFSGKDDEYNTIEGLREEGIAGQARKENTDFGSGWVGILAEGATPIRMLLYKERAIEAYKNNEFSGKDDAWVGVEGLRHKGVAGVLRKKNTDFGSGVQNKVVSRALEVFSGITKKVKPPPLPKRVMTTIKPPPLPKDKIQALRQQKEWRITSEQGEEWVIGQRLGKGGFGEVYSATSAATGREAVYKRALPGKEGVGTVLEEGQRSIWIPRIVGRGASHEQKVTLHEATMAAREHAVATLPAGRRDILYEAQMQHYAHKLRPDIVPEVYGTTSEGFFQEKLARGVKVSELGQAKEFVGKSMKELRKAGVMHMDPSATNVMVTAEGQMKLTDFGMSVLTENVKKNKEFLKMYKGWEKEGIPAVEYADFKKWQQVQVALPRAVSPHEQIKGLSEGPATKEMRRKLGIPHESVTNLAKAVAFAKKEYTGMLSKVLKQRGYNPKNVKIWSTTFESAEGGMGIMAKAETLSGDPLIDITRRMQTESIDLGSITIQKGIQGGGLGREIYQREADIFRRMGYDPGTKVTSTVVNPRTAKLQMRQYKSEIVEAGNIYEGNVVAKADIPDLKRRILDKAIKDDDLPGLTMVGRLGEPKQWRPAKATINPVDNAPTAFEKAVETEYRTILPQQEFFPGAADLSNRILSEQRVNLGQRTMSTQMPSSKSLVGRARVDSRPPPPPTTIGKPGASASEIAQEKATKLIQRQRLHKDAVVRASTNASRPGSRHASFAQGRKPR